MTLVTQESTLVRYNVQCDPAKKCTRRTPQSTLILTSTKREMYTVHPRVHYFTSMSVLSLCIFNSLCVRILEKQENIALI